MFSNFSRSDVGVGPVARVDAEVARSTRAAELVKRFLVDSERGQVFEQRPVAPAGDGRVDPFRCETVIAGDPRGVLAHRCGDRARRLSVTVIS